MRKIMLIISATMLIAFGYAQNWEKVNFPFDVMLKNAICKGDTAIIFGAGKIYWADKNNWDWQNKNMPVAEDIKKCLEFKGKFYAISNRNLLISTNGLDWQIKLTATYNIFWIFSNGTKLFFLSGGRSLIETEDGENFISQPSLRNFLDSSQHNGSVMATCLGDTILAIAIDDGLQASRSLISTDGGNSWSWYIINVSGIIPTSFISRYGESNSIYVDLVGVDRAMGLAYYHIFNENFDLESFSSSFGYPGKILTTCYWSYIPNSYWPRSWQGGYITNSMSDHTPRKGIIVSSNDLSTLQFVDYAVRCLTSGSKFALAVGDSGQIYASNKEGLGLEETVDLDNKIFLFPNPTSGSLTISHIIPGTEISIHNSLGQEIMRFIPQQEESHIFLRFVPGIYYLRQGTNVEKILLY